MKDCRWELTKEEYKELYEMKLPEKERAVKKMLGDSIVLGYGLYGWGLKQEGEKYFLDFTMGSHCD